MKRAPWILSSWRDMLLFVATPLVIFPAILMVRRGVSIEQIAFYVAAFGALGHHVPGLLRSYGDPELFRRFRSRLILAPLLLLALCLSCSFGGVQAPLVAALLWGFWHALAQVYGFARIYDGKGRSFHPVTARLDFLLCLFWFGSALLVSHQARALILEGLYAAGLPLLPPGWVVSAKQAWLGATALLTVAYLAAVVWRWRQGVAPCWPKLALLLVSAGFWWYTHATIASLVLGIALFEIFHDVQYLSLVWHYERQRAAGGKSAASFMAFLFRNSWAMVGLYVGLVFAYGSIGLLRDGTQRAWLSEFVIGFITASTLLHFYLDGFIWKVREPETRAILDLEPGTARPAAARRAPPWLLHGLKWSALIVPVAVLAILQTRTTVSALDRYENLNRIAPASWHVQTELSREWLAVGRIPRAITTARKAVELAPDEPGGHVALGNARELNTEFAVAAEHYERALELQPDHEEAHFNQGTVRAQLGQATEALAHFDRSRRLIASEEWAASRYAGSLVAIDHVADAIVVLEGLVGKNPDDVDLHYNLAHAYHRAADHDAAKATLAKLIALQPEDAVPHIYMAWLLAADPKDANEAAEAVRTIEKAALLRGGQQDALLADTAGVAYAAAGRFDTAIGCAEAAITIAKRPMQLPPGYTPDDAIAIMTERLNLYRSQRPYREPSGSLSFGLLPPEFRR